MSVCHESVKRKSESSSVSVKLEFKQSHESVKHASMLSLSHKSGRCEPELSQLKSEF